MRPFGVPLSKQPGGIMKKTLIAAALLISSQAQAGIIYDTMKGPYDYQYDIFALVHYDEIAIPFVVPTAGRITKIETLLTPTGGTTALLFGIATTALLGEPGHQYQSSIWNTTICPSAQPTYCFSNENPFDPRADHYLTPGQFFSTDLNLALQPGGYWLHAGFKGDHTYASWVMGSVRSETMWYRTDESNGWRNIGTVDDEGIPWTLPAARIFFEPNAVPEPGSFALLGLGLMFLAMTRARHNDA
jgi:hypothetical protein